MDSHIKNNTIITFEILGFLILGIAIKIFINPAFDMWYILAMELSLLVFALADTILAEIKWQKEMKKHQEKIDEILNRIQEKEKKLKENENI